MQTEQNSLQLDHRSIAAFAYQIWLRERCPHGRDVEHWSQAEQELAGPSQRQPAESPAPEKVKRRKANREPLRVGA